MKKTARCPKIEIEVEKIKHQKGKREEKKLNSSKKAKKETHKRMRRFLQIAGSHATRGVYNRDNN